VWSDDKLWPWQEQVQLEIYASQAAVLHPAIAAPFGTTVHPLALINASRFPSLRARAWTNATLLDASSSGSACGFLVLVNTDETAPELFQLELTSAPPTAANDSAAVRLFDAGYTKPLMRSTDGTGSGDGTGSTGGGNKLLEDWVGPGEVNIYLLGSPTACARLKTDDGSNEPPPATTATTTASSVVDVGTAEHLLLWGDSALTANTTLVAKTHPPTKTGIMTVVPDKPWERLIYMFNTIVKVNETDYRIYYDAFGLSTDGSRTGGRFTCVALSTDGTTYTKPSLGLVMFMNSTDNNIIGVVGPGSPTVTPLGGRQWGSVFLDTNPQTPHRFFLVGHDVFASPDGFAWTLLSAGHIPFSDTQTAVYFDPVTSNYSIYYRAHSLGSVHQKRGGCPGKAQKNGGHGDAFGGDAPTRSVGLFVTPNLTALSWGAADLQKEDPNLVDIVLKADAGDQPCMDLYTSAAVRVADATFLFPMQYLHCNEGRSNATPGHPISAPVPCTVGAVGNDGLLDVGFAASRDGRTAFERFDRAPFLPRGMGQPRTGCPTESGAVGVCRGVWEGAHDAGSTNIAVGTMDRGDETLMVGGGYQYTHGGWVKFREPGGPVRSGLQLLMLRRHGFVSLRPRTPAAPAEQPVGTLRTQLLRLPTCDTAEQLALELNLDTAVSGFATVAVESPGRPPLRSIELVGNSVHFEVQFAKYVDNWNNSAHALPTDLQGAVVRLSFQLTGNADLYGFQLQCRRQQVKPRPLKTDDHSSSSSSSSGSKNQSDDDTFNATTTPASRIAFNLSIGNSLGTLQHRASGFLQSMGARPVDNGDSNYTFSIPDKYLAPLRPFGFRSMDAIGAGDFITGLYPFLRRQGFQQIQVIVQDSFGPGAPFQPASSAAHKMCIFKSISSFNCTTFEANLEYTLRQWDGLELSFDIWNELDGFGSHEAFFVTWRSAVCTIRRLRPRAEIIGPSDVSPLADTLFNLSFWEDFLDFAQSENVLPDIFSWHDGLEAESPAWPHPPLWVGNGSEIVRSATLLRGLLAQRNITKFKLSVNEYGNMWYSVPPLPAAITAYIANLERAGIDSAMRSCWRETPWSHGWDQCDNATLDGLLTMDPLPRPRPAWWVYAAYGQASGQTVVASEGRRNDVDGVGAVDCKAMRAVFVVGYFPVRPLTYSSTYLVVAYEDLYQGTSCVIRQECHHSLTHSLARSLTCWPTARLIGSARAGRPRRRTTRAEPHTDDRARRDPIVPAWSRHRRQSAVRRGAYSTRWA
jgi:hypothetical protein